MASGFFFRGGPWELDSAVTTASTALAVLDSLTTTTGKLALGATGSKVTGVALGTKAVGDAATTAIQYIRALPNRTKFMAQAKNSSNLVATDLHGAVNLYGLTGAQGFDRAGSTKEIFLFKILSTGTSGQALITFMDPKSESST